MSCRCPHNMVNFGLLAAEICWRVWGTPANFNGFHVLAALLHGSQVVGVSQTSKLCGIEQRTTPMFGRATITLGIGPHSSCDCSVVYVRQHKDSSINFAETALYWIWNHEDLQQIQWNFICRLLVKLGLPIQNWLIWTVFSISFHKSWNWTVWGK